MAFETKLEVSDQEVIPSRSLDAKESYSSNQSLVGLQRILAELEVFVIKCASNNSPNVVKPEDVRTIKQHLAAYKQEKEFYQKYNDQPGSSGEFEYGVVFPSADEIQGIYNQRLKKFVLQVGNLRKILQSSAASGIDNHVDDATWEAVARGESAVADAIVYFLESKSGPADLKPAGRILVSGDFKFERLRQPSPDLPKDQFVGADSNSSGPSASPSGL